jgi:hypothetical protein
MLWLQDTFIVYAGWKLFLLISKVPRSAVNSRRKLMNYVKSTLFSTSNYSRCRSLKKTLSQGSTSWTALMRSLMSWLMYNDDGFILKGCLPARLTSNICCLSKRHAFRGTFSFSPNAQPWLSEVHSLVLNLCLNVTIPGLNYLMSNNSLSKGSVEPSSILLETLPPGVVIYHLFLN